MYHRAIAAGALVTPEFAVTLSQLSAEIRRQVGVLVNRKGVVEYVVVGTREGLELPDFKRTRTDMRRFRGLRCLHTHFGPAGLSQEDLTDLSLLRLDAMSAIEVDETGRPGKVHTAHLAPDFKSGGQVALDGLWQLLPPTDIHSLQLDFAALIRDLEAEFVRNMPRQWAGEESERAILIGVTTGRLEEERERLDELEELAGSADLEVLERFVQRRPRLDPRYLMGQGKLQQIIIISMQLGATLLVFNQDLTPTQARAICRQTDLKVIDRTQLILDIFARRATSQEGKIQVELAQLKYLMPRLVEFDDALSRLTGGIGGRGPGETSLEVNKRRLKDRMDRLEDKLESVRKARRQQRSQRQRKGMPKVSIVGYTNAGKSTLMNVLTHARAAVEDKLFATLEPVSRRMRLPWHQEVVVSDTVGFIRDLPTELREAFKATLEEIEDSALLIHLADASNPFLEQQVRTVERLLGEIGLDHIPSLLVLNKADLLDPEHREALARRWEAPLISARDSQGIEALMEQVQARLAGPQAPPPAELEPASPTGWNHGTH